MIWFCFGFCFLIRSDFGFVFLNVLRGPMDFGFVFLNVVFGPMVVWVCFLKVVRGPMVFWVCFLKCVRGPCPLICCFIWLLLVLVASVLAGWLAACVPGCLAVLALVAHASRGGCATRGQLATLLRCCLDGSFAGWLGGRCGWGHGFCCRLFFFAAGEAGCRAGWRGDRLGGWLAALWEG